MNTQPGQTEVETVKRSLICERETGKDSIPTIERVYDRSDSGAYLCVWPGCSFARRDAVAMWRHVHNRRAHPWPGAESDEERREDERYHMGYYDRNPI